MGMIFIRPNPSTVALGFFLALQPRGLLIVPSPGGSSGCHLAAGQAHPPRQVEAELCTINAVYAHLQQITTSPACRAGCYLHHCPIGWNPGDKDRCSVACGKVFEPFWDQCGSMLTQMQMGGMSGMGAFYNSCLRALYPPGTCGALCNLHTYDCHLEKVREACCEEGGTNCADRSSAFGKGGAIPKSCPVGCALVFPSFLDACHEHIEQTYRAQGGGAAHGPGAALPIIGRYDAFKAQCMQQDALALVDYALDLRKQGCKIDLGDGVSQGRRRRRRQQQVGGEGGGDMRRLQSAPAASTLSGMLDSRSPTCAWDDVDDYARAVDAVCCGAGGARCLGGQPPLQCLPACAVTFHDFTTSCAQTMAVLFPATDPRRAAISRFEEQCL
jgi:hypothetical protein